MQGFLGGLGSLDLNQNQIVQSDPCCHYTTPQSVG
jgi:hypothetical protein